LSAAIASRLAPTGFVSYSGIAAKTDHCGSWLASDPPQAAIKKRRKL
jgi:hypothetical protein